MHPDPPLRLRWDRIGALAAVLVALVLAAVFAVRGSGGGAAAPAARLVAATTRAAGPAAATAGSARTDPAGCGTATAPGGVLRHAPGPGRTVALTFDDGPSRYTEQVLDVLARHHVHASFFPVGGQLAPRRDLVSREAAEGHLVGNHTWSHRPPTGRQGWAAPQLAAELSRTQDALRAVTGAPTCWFRPPQGVLAGAPAVAAAQRMRIALWSVDSLDWQVQSAARRGNPLAMAQDIQRNALAPDQEHPVVLLHDGGGDRAATVAALPNVILAYQARGYTFVRLDGRP